MLEISTPYIFLAVEEQMKYTACSTAAVESQHQYSWAYGEKYTREIGDLGGNR